MAEAVKAATRMAKVFMLSWLGSSWCFGTMIAQEMSGLFILSPPALSISIPRPRALYMSMKLWKSGVDMMHRRDMPLLWIVVGQLWKKPRRNFDVKRLLMTDLQQPA